MRLDWLTRFPIAHRGLHNKTDGVYENTLTSFTRAIESDFAIECDVQFSADGIPFIFHDYDLQRLCGLSGNVREKLASELTLLSIGQTKDRIPTLENMLDLVSGRVPLILELKGCKGDDDGFAGAVLETLKDYQGPVALMSFDHHLLCDFYKFSCLYPLGLVAEGKKGEDFFAHEQALGYNIAFISYSIEHLPNAFIEAQRQQGRPIIAWTITNQKQMLHSNKYADQITFEGFIPENT